MEQLQTIYHNSLNVSLSQYCSSGAVQYSVVGTLVFGTIVYILNKVTKEYSWVDRVWSLLPVIYGAHFLYHQKACTSIPISTRQIIMFSLTTLWGIRLTYNFYRKGGYKKGGQDYRWEYIRKNYHWSVVEILNIVFISYYQIILILWFSSPVYAAHEGPLNLVDIVLTFAWLAFFAGEVTADQQQWNFQTEKYRILKENNNNKQKLPAQYRRGFIIDGLFKYSRHPNFFCEISIWWVQFLFSYNSVGLNWTGLGALLLNLLFLGSTYLTQKISSEKYPKYKAYQKTTSMLIPLPSSKQYEDFKQE